MPGALPLGIGESGAEQGGLDAGFGASGRDLAAELDRLRTYTLSLGEILEDLRVKYNAHTHVENTAATYTQNATTQAPPAGSQSTVAATPE
ncbi:MAG: hypothetical protein CL878_07670 [Dehalococcoidia bacterium]|nr:hypothetical protein [Dehalococcoidia bacterium]